MKLAELKLKKEAKVAIERHTAALAECDKQAEQGETVLPEMVEKLLNAGWELTSAVARYEWVRMGKELDE